MAKVGRARTDLDLLLKLNGSADVMRLRADTDWQKAHLEDLGKRCARIERVLEELTTAATRVQAALTARVDAAVTAATERVDASTQDARRRIEHWRDAVSAELKSVRDISAETWERVEREAKNLHREVREITRYG
jgi:ElaB/YqjD/DUF883 family membrane-anchored ribosome-binding protein